MVKLFGRKTTRDRSMSSVNIVVGLSGVGKSTVLEEAMLLADEEYEVINYGDRMLETAKQQGLVDTRDEMKDIGVEKYKEIQKDAAESIVDDAEEAEDGNVIVDTHAAIKTPYGYIPGLPKWTVENLDPEKIIILDASAEELYRRSQKDEDRDREHDDVEDIEEYRQVAREMASAGSVLTGAYLKVIENKKGKAQQAARDLIDTLNA
ncbi:adenylate kinase [Candidatus Nanohaloarchaea archaeon]|nr:adenylate kinase [Candidatus Nanohaloarchaea archaeon]